jgi:threonine dehydrogenase-like Zn-dependent dehydrogenase
MAAQTDALDALVTHELPLGDLRAACDTARDKHTGAIKVVVRP